MDVSYVIKMDSKQYCIADGVPPIVLPVHPLERLVSDFFDNVFLGMGCTNSFSDAVRSEMSLGGYDVHVRAERSSKGHGFDVEMIVDDTYTVESLDDLKRFRVENCGNNKGKLLLTFKNRLRGTELEYRFTDDGRVFMGLSSMTSLSDLKQKLNDTIHLVLPKYSHGALIDTVKLSHSTSAGLKIYFPVNMSRDNFLEHFMDSIRESYHEIVEESARITLTLI